MDYSLAHALDGFSARHDGFEDVLSWLMPFAEPFFALVLVVLFFANRRASLIAAASFAVAAVSAAVIGGLVDRPRPFVAHAGTIQAFLPHAADAGFPSDHASASFAIATAVALQRRAWGVPLLVLAALVSAGRVFLGLHYPGDVAAGAVLGAAAALSAHAAAGRLWPRHSLAVR